MAEVICRGLLASWVNAWLAAVGATVLVPSLRLRWTLDGSPRAVLCVEEAEPAMLLADAWPSPAELSDLPLARTWRDTPPIARKVSVQAFAARAQAVRSHPASWTLSSTLTDLDVDEDGQVFHAPFDAPVPLGFTLHDRLVKVSGKVKDPSVERLLESLQGTGTRVQNNGLGFDIARLASRADNTKPWVDPVIETLAFFGLALLPVRGSGTDKGINKSARSSARQRGWQYDGPTSVPRFHWPAWSPLLDSAAIDALLDIWNWKDRGRWGSLGVHVGWRTVAFRPRNPRNPTRGFGSERL